MNTDNRPLVSAIIPTYNREKTIEYSIRSILNQSYKNIEVIIVDDCSTDGTETVIKKINDDRVRYFKLEENRKACFARNLGIEKSKGEYIAFNDSDDSWHSDKIEKQMKYLEKTKSDLVFSRIFRILLNGDKHVFPSKTPDMSKDFFKQELVENYMCTVTLLMKKKVADEVKFDTTLKRFQDWDFGIGSSKRFKVEFLDEPLVDSYMQNDSITKNVPPFDAINQIYEKYKSDFNADKRARAEIYKKLGDALRKTDSQEAGNYYKQSIGNCFSVKVAIKYLLTLADIKF